MSDPREVAYDMPASAWPFPSARAGLWWTCFSDPAVVAGVDIGSAFGWMDETASGDGGGGRACGE